MLWDPWAFICNAKALCLPEERVKWISSYDCLQLLPKLLGISALTRSPSGQGVGWCLGTHRVDSSCPEWDETSFPVKRWCELVCIEAPLAPPFPDNCHMWAIYAVGAGGIVVEEQQVHVAEKLSFASGLGTGSLCRGLTRTELRCHSRSGGWAEPSLGKSLILILGTQATHSRAPPPWRVWGWFFWQGLAAHTDVGSTKTVRSAFRGRIDALILTPTEATVPQGQWTRALAGPSRGWLAAHGSCALRCSHPPAATLPSSPRPGLGLAECQAPGESLHHSCWHCRTHWKFLMGVSPTRYCHRGRRHVHEVLFCSTLGISIRDFFWPFEQLWGWCPGYQLTLMVWLVVLRWMMMKMQLWGDLSSAGTPEA